MTSPAPADVLAIVATLPPLSPAARSRVSLLLRPRQQQGNHSERLGREEAS